MTTVEKFLAQAKENAERKAKEMSTLELTFWDGKHEQELKKFHGFTEATLKARKKELTQKAE